MNRELFLVIAEDNRILLDAVAINMEMDTKIKIAKASTLEQAIGILRDYRREYGKDAHVALVDLELPDAYGVEAISRILKESPETAVVAYTGHEEWEELSLKSGAISFICKGNPNSHGAPLIHEIRTAVIKNDVRLCHKPKNQAIDNALQKVSDASSLLSGEITVEQLKAARKSREPRSGSSAIKMLAALIVLGVVFIAGGETRSTLQPKKGVIQSTTVVKSPQKSFDERLAELKQKPTLLTIGWFERAQVVPSRQREVAVALESAAQSTDLDSVRAAVAALGKWGTIESVPVIQTVFDRERGQTKRYAELALQRLQ